jgi:hypothetical protein
MNTKVYRIDLNETQDINTAITLACENQYLLGFKLASTFVWGTNLVLIFQKV